MFTIVLIVMLAGLVAAASVRFQRPRADPRVTALLLISYAIRIALATSKSLTSDLGVFSGGPGGFDSGGYENGGEIIAHMWRYRGIHYVGPVEMGYEGLPTLPSNVFACVIYPNGAPTHVGCVAIVAAIACLVCLDLYLIALTLGARSNVALSTAAFASILPSFLFYTSDTYKDGFVALFVIGIFGCSLRLARKFSVTQLALAFAFSVGLWQTRFYLVYVIPGPILLGFLGVRSRSMLRTVMAALVVTASLAALYTYSRAPEAVVGHATRTFEGATSREILSANAEGGSGVTFDETSALGAFPSKLAYTLFSPFPWQAGSLGLQIGKIEVLIWYYFVYRAAIAAKLMWRERRSDLVMFISLVVPMTVAYAFSFSNIGLILRQRMGIVLVTMVLATLSWGRKEIEEDGARKGHIPLDSSRPVPALP